MACWLGSSPAGCILIRVAAALAVMSGSLSLSSSRSMFGVLLVDSRSWIWIYSGLSVCEVTQSIRMSMTE
jgi:hypothetical protein